jgi:AraC family transcriptional regulator
MIPKLALGTFFGDNVTSYAVAGLRLSEWTYASELRLPRHAHERAYLNMVLSGGHTESYGRQCIEHLPFTVVFHPEGEIHENHFGPVETRVFDVETEPHWLERARQYGQPLDQPAVFARSMPVWLMTRLYNELHDLDPVSPLAIEGLVLELLAAVSRHPDPIPERQAPRWLRRVRGVLQDRFANRLSLDEMAREAGVHPDHLTRAFRCHYHSTIGDYVRRLRIEYACRELITTDTPLGEIALTAGFTDQSHFTRIFRRQMGMTPAQFRRDFRRRRFHTMR